MIKTSCKRKWNLLHDVFALNKKQIDFAEVYIQEKS